MTEEKAFDQRVRKILREYPNSNMSATIAKVKTLYPKSNDYHFVFDDFCERIGVQFTGVKVFHPKQDRIIGWQPVITYLNSNLLNKQPEEVKLRSVLTPVTPRVCCGILADSLIESLSWTPNLDSVIENLD